MCIVLWRKHAKDIIILMYGLAVIATFLLIPPVGVGVTKLAGNCRGVEVATVHVWVLDVGLGEMADLWAVGEGGDGGAEDLV